MGIMLCSHNVQHRLILYLSDKAAENMIGNDKHYHVICQLYN